MNRKRQYTRDDALAVAMELRDALAPLCERIEIAGSIRRHKPLVSDIELLYISKTENRPEDMFATKEVSLADEMIWGWLRDGVIIKREGEKGSTVFGPENKFCVHVPSGIAVDFFATDKVRWYVALVVRTGGRTSNMQLTTGAQRHGRKLHAYGAGVRSERGDLILCTSEEEVFAQCGVPYKEPWERP